MGSRREGGDRFLPQNEGLKFPRTGEFFNVYWFIVLIIQFSVTLIYVVFKETVIYDGMWDAFSRSRVSLVIKLQGGERARMYSLCQPWQRCKVCSVIKGRDGV